ncbi:MAG: MFS transporter [Candidatus Omnitrophica bacterium]|nr:MFS transporter [Candidatus Omnitrophota bacterium]MBU1047172.1 MFS transporter [Candidatus Omnitrophota bacterium]MBU1630470.1 MFS transporter [Candidatus Omnitrophota bacterium]MBU1766635.1 MFS transporter [Candidatus Omnitrophota bacterium]MBU1889472.1 MFS transporter [Candidatus Omnitrophota bacterium]
MILLIIVSAAFGLSVGLYDFLLPLFLDDMGMSYGSMGIIFSFSAIFMFFVRVYAGHISDLFGRKHVFSLSVFLCGLSTLLTPFLPNIASQVVLRSLREIARAVKETLQQLLIFDKWKESFRHLSAWIGGADFTFQGIGILLGGFLLIKIGYKYSFIIPGAIVVLVCLLFLFKFKESYIPLKTQKVLSGDNVLATDSFYWSSPFQHRLPRPLVLMAVSGFILGTGVSMSHSFMAPLFFLNKFAISPAWVAIILAFHRLSFGLPMIMAGKIVKWNLKRTIIIFVLLQGIFVSLTAVPGYFLTAAIIWLMHDLFGASLWVPARNTLIQQYAREGKRGLDVGMVLSWQGMGWIFGPLLAGLAAKSSINYPFILSGIITSLSVIPLFWLKDSFKKSQFVKGN